jgi:hypothetical protein
MRALQDILHSPAVFGLFSGPAIFRVQQRDKVVNQVNSPQAIASDPSWKRRLVQTSVTYVQIEHLIPWRALPRCRER